MKGETKKRWMELCELAANEQHPFFLRNLPGVQPTSRLKNLAKLVGSSKPSRSLIPATGKAVCASSWSPPVTDWRMSKFESGRELRYRQAVLIRCSSSTFVSLRLSS